MRCPRGDVISTPEFLEYIRLVQTRQKTWADIFEEHYEIPLCCRQQLMGYCSPDDRVLYRCARRIGTDNFDLQTTGWMGLFKPNLWKTPIFGQTFLNPEQHKNRSQIHRHLRSNSQPPLTKKTASSRKKRARSEQRQPTESQCNGGMSNKNEIKPSSFSSSKRRQQQKRQKNDETTTQPPPPSPLQQVDSATGVVQDIKPPSPKKAARRRRPPRSKDDKSNDRTESTLPFDGPTTTTVCSEEIQIPKEVLETCCASVEGVAHMTRFAGLGHIDHPLLEGTAIVPPNGGSPSAGSGSLEGFAHVTHAMGLETHDIDNNQEEKNTLHVTFGLLSEDEKGLKRRGRPPGSKNMKRSSTAAIAPTAPPKIIPFGFVGGGGEEEEEGDEQGRQHHGNSHNRNHHQMEIPEPLLEECLQILVHHKTMQKRKRQNHTTNGKHNQLRRHRLVFSDDDDDDDVTEALPSSPILGASREEEQQQEEEEIDGDDDSKMDIDDDKTTTTAVTRRLFVQPNLCAIGSDGAYRPLFTSTPGRALDSVTHYSSSTPSSFLVPPCLPSTNETTNCVFLSSSSSFFNNSSSSRKNLDKTKPVKFVLFDYDLDQVLDQDWLETEWTSWSAPRTVQIVIAANNQKKPIQLSPKATLLYLWSDVRTTCTPELLLTSQNEETHIFLQLKSHRRRFLNYELIQKHLKMSPKNVFAQHCCTMLSNSYGIWTVLANEFWKTCNNN